MDVERAAPGSAALQLADGVRLLRPDEQVFTAMLDGWRNQQLARNLSFGTVESRQRAVRAFAAHAQALPWRWTPQLVDEWCTDLRAVRRVRRSTLRGYQEAVRLFCAYLTDPAYGWVGECEKRFGTHPVQVVHEWNAAVHVAAAEGDPAKRAFTLDEMQALLDYADEQVTRIRAAGRKGWLPAYRDAALFKVAYGYGLRRNETRMLDVADFGRNPHADEFGEYGVLYVRHGKAMKGSPPKRRSVLTVWAWVPEVLAEWVEEIRPLLAVEGNPALWPSERAPRVGLAQLNARLSAYRDALGLDAALDSHSLRRSYVTHLIEAGWDPLFLQQQVGHEHASTTAIYTCVSSDFRTRTLRQALDATMDAALRPARRAR
ncbi:Tyrosine recombinase XerC [Micromonospora sp. MH33]|uniref:tyrosine-type recombinase/integrase n=1 Tax=Micromonospora sp. MH33 TaxID=1945509 RepID=UPI000D2E2100|nr:site-specific integrase [Micromonospora sp. MH33]PSK67818.1 Tyrosine recombinase XerC [Micromonospora sp. MH33]